MANDKNFVVKNGLTVDTNTLYVDATTDRVGINTTSPLGALHVVDDAYVSGEIFVGDAGTFTNGIITPVLDTADSSAITIIPAATFASDITVENNIYSNNIVSAQYFVGDGSLLTGIDTGSGAAYRIVEYPTVTNGSADVTMSTAYPIANIDVYLNGAQLKATDDYTVSGSTLTLGTTLETGDVVTVVGYQAATTATLDNLSDTSVSGQASNTLIKFNGSAYVPTSMVEDSSGNVGIGTSSPTELLHITSASSDAKIVLESGVNTTSNGIEWVDENGTTTTEFYYGHANNRQDLNVNGNGFQIYSKQGSAVVAKFGINSSANYTDNYFPGNVGIGTSSPEAQLHVKNSSGNSVSILGQYGTGTKAEVGAYANLVDIRAHNGTNDVLTFTTGSSERMRITSAGELLVNKTTNSITADGFMVNSVGQILAVTPTSFDAGVFYRKTTSTGNGVILTKSDVGGTNTLVGAGFANGTFGTISDINKKKNIEDARGYLEDLMQIRVVKYNWKSDEDSAPKELGWIAQEVEQVFPGMVEEMEGSKLLKKEVFVPMLLKAIQEQQTQIEALEARLAALEGGA